MAKNFVFICGFLFVFLGFSTSQACDMHGNSGIVEDNDLWIGVEDKSDNGMTEQLFNSIIDDINEIYMPVFSDMGKRLELKSEWEDGTVNAYARQSGNNWEVMMFGGLARHEAATPDAFALVVCHEIGHHIGGRPKNETFWGTNSWASNEGQADYFGTSKCFRHYVETHDNERIVENMNIPEIVTEKCKDNFSHSKDVAICQRSAMAGLSLGNLFSDLAENEKPLDFETPDTSVVDQTFHGHPEAQCRLDTYFQASLCEVDHYTDIIDSDVTHGVCNRSTGHTNGPRPLCWYKAKF